MQFLSLRAIFFNDINLLLPLELLFKFDALIYTETVIYVFEKAFFLFGI